MKIMNLIVLSFYSETRIVPICVNVLKPTQRRVIDSRMACPQKLYSEQLQEL